MLTLDDLRACRDQLEAAIKALEAVAPIAEVLRRPAVEVRMARSLPAPEQTPPVHTSDAPAPESNQLVCQQCGTPITPKTGRGGRQKRFCSAACRAAASDARRGPRSKAPVAPPAGEKASEGGLYRRWSCRASYTAPGSRSAAF